MNIIPINEVFTSPNGEGITTGLMTLFIRTAGCNFAIEGHPCKWNPNENPGCDTPYAWYPNQCKFSATPEQLIQEIDKEMLIAGIREICLTGGEPLYHNGIEESIKYWDKKYHLLVETNGSLPIWKSDACWSLDIKCPSSNNAEYNYYQNLELLTQKDQVKFIISNRDDFNFARDIVKSRVVLTNVIFQPAWKLLSHAELIEWVKNDRDIAGIVRIGSQNHKYWYPRRKRGV